MGFPELLAQIGAEHITAPNFSFPLDVPRIDNLLNRSRSLKTAEELAKAGMSVIPHLNAVTATDWEFWRDFLKEHDEITTVAKEFQTGTARVTTARWHIGYLRRLEDVLGRQLHIVAVGGRRYLPLLHKLSAVTIVDSVPFMKAMYRRALCRREGRWSVEQTQRDAPLDDLLATNIEEYARAIEDVHCLLQAKPAALPAPPLTPVTTGTGVIPSVLSGSAESQLAFSYS
jgi:hypothetical protein